MNNSEIGATFVAMCNGTTEKKTINGRNNLSVRIVGEMLALYSYSTPIAVYDGAKVVINQTFLSSATSKHQNTISRKAFTCPVSIVLHFGGFCGNSYGFQSPAAYTCRELLEQAAPRYYYAKTQHLSANNRIYYRWTLYKATPETEKISGCTATTLHHYTTEQAAKDEAARLNSLAYSWSVQ